MVNLVNFPGGWVGEHVNVAKTVLVYLKKKERGRFCSVLGFPPPAPYKFTMFTKFTDSWVAA